MIRIHVVKQIREHLHDRELITVQNSIKQRELDLDCALLFVVLAGTWKYHLVKKIFRSKKKWGSFLQSWCFLFTVKMFFPKIVLCVWSYMNTISRNQYLSVKKNCHFSDLKAHLHLYVERRVFPGLRLDQIGSRDSWRNTWCVPLLRNH